MSTPTDEARHGVRANTGAAVPLPGGSGSGKEDGMTIASLREKLERATPGPWCHRQANKAGLDWLADSPNGKPHRKIIIGRGSLYGGTPDYALIAAMRNELPSLLARYEALLKAVERLGSTEAFTLSRAIVPGADDELIARVDFARIAYLKGMGE